LLALVLLDITVRRVAWDRWLPGRREIAAAPAAGAGLAAGLAMKLEHGSAGMEPAIALGEEDARALAKKARDERMARKLAGMRKDPGEAPRPAPITEKPAAPSEPSEGGLMAAKRRAKERFDE
jgi:hypothetical protein